MIVIRLALAALAAVLVARRAAAAARPPLDLETATVAELQAALEARTLTSEELTRGYVQRIRALNTEGPGLNAVRALNGDAVADARALDRERRRGQVRGPLHGIPVLVKDNVDVARDADDGRLGGARALAAARGRGDRARGCGAPAR